MNKVFKALQRAQRERGGGRPAEPAEPAAEPVPPVADPAGPVAAERVEPPPPPAAPAPVPEKVKQPARRHAPPRPHSVEDDADLEGIEPHLVSLVDPLSFAADQYRTLRHIVEQANRADRVSVLAVSSPTIGDGKTTTAINLAGALAQGVDARVLLVDADLRNPSVASRLALRDTERGLVDLVLDPGLSLDDVARRRAPFNLWVLPAGPPTTSPYELLKSARLGEVLDEARHEYDYVVLDTPPLVPIPDCRVIGRYVDSFLLVVTANKTGSDVFEEALRVLGPSKILGLVFNGGNVGMRGGYYPGYGYAAGYVVHNGRNGSSNGASGPGQQPRLRRFLRGWRKRPQR